MGWGCYLTTTIYYNGHMFRSKDEVFDEIELNNSIIANCEKELLMYMTMTEPAKFWRESEAEVGETPLVWLQNEVQHCIDSIKENTEKNAVLQILLDKWDECHTKNGKAIAEPKTNKIGSYYGGDEIATVYPDGSEAYTPKFCWRSSSIKDNDW